VWPRPDPRSRSRSRSFWSSENCTFLGLSPPPFSRGAQNWWLVVIVWYLVYSLLSPIFELPSRKAMTGMSRFHEIQMAIFPHVRDATVTWSGMLEVLQVLCTLLWPWPDPRTRSRSLTFCLPKIALFYVPPPLFWRGAHNWWVITTVWDLVYSFSEPDFWISPQLSVTRVTSKFARCWYHQNPLSYISERELMFTFDICCRPSVCRLSVCLSVCMSVCRRNASAPYSGGYNFRQHFYGTWYLGHPLTSKENFMEIVPGELMRLGS